MQAIGRGILPDSPIYFYTPSNLAGSMYFYPMCVGKYHCDGNYIVQRKNYDSFLLIHVIEGRGYTERSGVRQILKRGDFALIDCYQPHCYGSDDGWDILWVHFDGPLARQFFEAIPNLTPLPCRTPDSALRSMYRIFNTFHEHMRIEESLFNKYLTDILTGFLASTDPHASWSGSAIEEICTYISDNPQRNLCLEELARRANLSTYYFLRLFKMKVGCTPHKYQIMARINAAKFYLKTSNLPIKDITYNLGFSSESSFCSSFKKVTGCTPNQYRASGDPAGSAE